MPYRERCGGRIVYSTYADAVRALLEVPAVECDLQQVYRCPRNPDHFHATTSQSRAAKAGQK
jgi:hypothetical protein